MNKVDRNQHVLFIFRLKFDNNKIVSISTLKKINKTSKGDLLEYLFTRLNKSSESYNVIPISTIIFSYGIREGEIIPDLVNKKKDIKYQTFYNNKLPIAILPEEYGPFDQIDDNIYYITLSKKVNMVLKTIINDQGDKVNKIRYYKNGQLIFNWIDTVLNNNSFIREIGKSTYYYDNKELTLVKVLKQTKPISKTKVSKILSNKIITMDLETILINNTHVPYLLSWYDGKINKSYFIKSLSNEGIALEKAITYMISEAMTDISIRKYRGYRVYLHNFSKFDGYFLVKYLSQIGKCNPIINDGKIITLNFHKFNSNYNIIFKDSFLLLPSSLRKLAFSFNVKNKSPFFLSHWPT
jgi:hypothetical protein